MNKYSIAQLKTRCCERAAYVLKGNYEEDSGVHSRIFEVLIPDNYVITGESLAGKGYREHIVPCAFIRDECMKMYGDDAEIKDVAEAIEHHLKIILITKEEASFLDYEKGLKTSMPSGWVFNKSDVYARLHEANIKFREYDL